MTMFRDSMQQTKYKNTKDGKQETKIEKHKLDFKNVYIII